MEYDDLNEILKVVRKSESEAAEISEPGWSLLPENVLVRIFKYISIKDILACSECCKRWNFISNDSLLWKYKFQTDFKVDNSIPRKPGSEPKNIKLHHSKDKSQLILRCITKREMTRRR